MGSGTGISLSFLARMGIPYVRGIDANPFLVETANRTFEDFEGAGLLPPNTCRTYLGNFFSEDFVVEESIRWNKLGVDLRTEIATHDPYAAMGQQISNFDIVFFYPFVKYERQLIRFLGERCHPGTVIFNLCPIEDTELPPNIRQIDSVQDDNAVFMHTYQIQEAEEIRSL